LFCRSRSGAVPIERSVGAVGRLGARQEIADELTMAAHGALQARAAALGCGHDASAFWRTGDLAQHGQRRAWMS